MRLFRIIICATLFIYFSSVHAVETRDERNKWYLGANLGSYQDVLDGDAFGGTFLFGFDLHKFIAIESRLGLTYDSAKDTAEGITTSRRSLISHASIYARGNLRFDTFTLFALGGYSYLRNDYEIEVSPPSAIVPSTEGDTDESDISYGGGIDLYGNATTALSFSWIRVIDLGDKGELDAWYIGVTHYLN